MGATPNRKPNIVWLTQDHVVWKHFRDTKGPKPRLAAYERIATEGTTFDRAYSVTPLCSPARASMLTGVYAHKHGITRNDSRSLKGAMNLETPVLSEFLKSVGYRCGYFGKWHAGRENAQEYGFEGFSLEGYGTPYQSEAYASYLKRFDLPDPIVDVEWSISGASLSDINMKDVESFAGASTNGFRSASTAHFKSPVEATEAYFVSQLACDWLEEAAQGEEPFLLRVDIWGPHQPYLVAEPFRNSMDAKRIPEYPNFSNSFADRPDYHKRDRDDWRNRTGFTEWDQWQPLLARAYEHFAQTDSAFLKVLDTIDRLGISEDTIVIYTADHGDILATNGGLFDKDAMLTEETMAIPLVVKWPGVTKQACSTQALVSNMDIVSTVLEWSGVQVPVHMDGLSLAGLITHINSANDSDFGIPSTWRKDLMAVHFGHKDYEKIQRALYWETYKYVAHLDDSDELYDLEQDPFELQNLIHASDKRNLLEEMKHRLHKQLLDHDDLSEDTNRLIEQKKLKP
ncbi:sulfatase-like hydrolase/transferase [Paenibacillus sp. Soil750]|uniref:sulfatase-like hydrolase/transferase n=1 Tax=Paenibacillus sp. Soil750 TaxID=1736398 RepID=UPI0007018814|nr:sulfatase-like hydrolase/transferase [Paenibacillus sp. Soil750]KRE64158.1 hypothetical protein ASL11_23330 [Paenibacillus sp. Soil750]